MDDHIKSLYETDALIWTDTQIALLRAGKFDQLDLENIISELGYQVRKDKHEVASRLRGLMAHLLKYQFQPRLRSKSWCRTIHQHRAQIEDVLNEMPSLRPQLIAYVARGYPKAIRSAALDTGLPLSAFPETNPYSVEQILDENFLPGENEKAADP